MLITGPSIQQSTTATIYTYIRYQADLHHNPNLQRNLSKMSYRPHDPRHDEYYASARHHLNGDLDLGIHPAYRTNRSNSTSYSSGKSFQLPQQREVTATRRGTVHQVRHIPSHHALVEDASRPPALPTRSTRRSGYQYNEPDPRRTLRRVRASINDRNQPYSERVGFRTDYGGGLQDLTLFEEPPSSRRRGDTYDGRSIHDDYGYGRYR